jgi:hypothetical protein
LDPTEKHFLLDSLLSGSESQKKLSILLVLSEDQLHLALLLTEDLSTLINVILSIKMENQCHMDVYLMELH